VVQTKPLLEDFNLGGHANPKSIVHYNIYMLGTSEEVMLNNDNYGGGQL
jgi:hypothetical protein